MSKVNFTSKGRVPTPAIYQSGPKYNLEGPIKILIVDDDPAVQLALGRVFKEFVPHSKVEVSETAKSAINKICFKSYDLIILDYALSGSLNGKSVAQFCSWHSKKTPVLFLSGMGDSAERFQVLPVDPGEPCADPGHA